jgi:hypothetical protein
LGKKYDLTFFKEDIHIQTRTESVYRRKRFIRGLTPERVIKAAEKYKDRLRLVIIRDAELGIITITKEDRMYEEEVTQVSAQFERLTKLGWDLTSEGNTVIPDYESGELMFAFADEGEVLVEFGPASFEDCLAVMSEVETPAELRAAKANVITETPEAIEPDPLVIPGPRVEAEEPVAQADGFNGDREFVEVEKHSAVGASVIEMEPVKAHVGARRRGGTALRRRDINRKYRAQVISAPVEPVADEEIPMPTKTVVIEVDAKERIRKQFADWNALNLYYMEHHKPAVVALAKELGLKGASRMKAFDLMKELCEFCGIPLGAAISGSAPAKEEPKVGLRTMLRRGIANKPWTELLPFLSEIANDGRFGIPGYKMDIMHDGCNRVMRGVLGLRPPVWAEVADQLVVLSVSKIS